MKSKFSLPNWALFLGLTFAFLCIYVLLSVKVIAIGYRMEDAKKKHENLDMLNENYKAEILRLTSQAELLKRAEKFNLQLVTPSRWCYMEIEKPEQDGKNNGKAEAGTD